MPIMAASEYLAERANGDRFSVLVRVGRPERQSTGEWSCSLKLDGLHADVMPVHGEDPIQALCLALGLAGSLLRDFINTGGKLSFADAPHQQVPLESYFGPFSTSMSPPAA